MRTFNENDKLVICWRTSWPNAQCEMCDHGVSTVIPEIIETLKEEPDWHTVCRECVQELIKQGHNIRYVGRYDNPTDARRILPPKKGAA